MRKTGSSRAFTLALLLCASIALGAGKRPYTVDDSIELASFSVAPIDAPDHRHFAVVTERGVVATNRTKSTIWLFDRAAVEQFVRHPASAPARPQALATMSATSNLPVIANLTWLDSHRLAFLGKNGTPYQQLFIADIDDGRVTAVTKSDRYAASYEIRGDTIAYTTLIEPPPSDRSEVLLSARDTSLQRLLDPDPPPIADIDFDSIPRFALALHVIRGAPR